MDSEKIVVVIAVLLVIFAGIITYLVFMDRRLKRLEREIQEKKS